MNYHTTLSKKALMKLLGLGNTGATGIVATPYRDLDEVKASPAAGRNLAVGIDIQSQQVQNG